MFSEALLNVLRTGIPNIDEFLTLYDVGKLIEAHLRDRYQNALVRPQVQCPNQPEGDLARLPLFPNPGCTLHFEERRGSVAPKSRIQQLPRDLIASLNNPLVQVRLAAITALIELYKRTTSKRIAELVNSELLRLSEEDDSKRVMTSAKDALAECSSFSASKVFDTAERETVTPVLGEAADLEAFNLFFSTAFKLSDNRQASDVWQTLLEFALKLTSAKRSFVFFCDDNSELQLRAGLDESGQQIKEDATVLQMIKLTSSHDLRVNGPDPRFGNLETIICIRFRNALLTSVEARDSIARTSELGGLLYLDAPYRTSELSDLCLSMLKTSATIATALAESTLLKENSDRYLLEMRIAGESQQRLMRPSILETPYARVNSMSEPCRELGGDFFDVIDTPKGLALIVADASGKGIAAAPFGCFLQGMLSSQLLLDVSLSEMLESVNRFICNKAIGEKYATVVVARLSPSGALEIINCGNVPPLIVSGGSVSQSETGSLPLGLIPNSKFEVEKRQLSPGDRLVLVSDGITEAENASADTFGIGRLARASLDGFSAIQEAVREFRGSAQQCDDSTLIEITYLSDSR